MNIRELRKSRQAHLEAQRRKGEELLAQESSDPWPYNLINERYQVPDGYQWPESADSYLPLICQRCGASVVHGSGIQIHDQWHEAQA